MFMEQKGSQTVRHILQTHAPDVEIGAFGSRMHGRTLEPFSDLDIALTESGQVVSELRLVLEESNLLFRVDVVDLAHVSPEFRKIIKMDKEHIQTARK